MQTNCYPFYGRDDLSYSCLLEFKGCLILLFLYKLVLVEMVDLNQTHSSTYDLGLNSA